MNGSSSVGRPSDLAILHVLFFCSGVGALTCEVVWFKQLGFVLGSSTFAASVVVACFFGGLSLGSTLFGQLADRVVRPLRTYALLELALAATALATTFVLSSWTQWIGVVTPYLSLEAARPVEVLLAMGILLPPTVLMGATLPVLSRHVVRRHGDLAERVGWLYAVNTLGAAVGCAAVGWVGIGALGVFGAAAAGSALYAAVGVAALGLSVRVPPLAQVATDDEPAPTASGPVPLAWVALFGGSGFVAIAYELLWFRMLRFFAAHTVYTFSVFLTVYLLGLVVGAAICARYLAPHKRELGTFFARLQLAIGVAGLVSFAILGVGRPIVWMFGASDPTWFTLVALAVAVLGPPTVLLGCTFPLASELAVESVRSVGSRIGLLYGANTLGGVLGSLAAGFVLLPWLGAQGSFLVLVAANFGLFAVIWSLDPQLRSRSDVRREAGLALAVVVVAAFALGPDHLKRAQTAFAGGDVLAFRETEDAAFVVMNYELPHTVPHRQIIVNGTSYANNRRDFRRYMALLAHLPVLVHPEPRSAVVICIGTGTTIGAVTQHPGLERIYAVDLMRDVFELAPHFEPVNHGFLGDPRVEPVVADGRHFLLVRQDDYDVLTFEPPPPQEAGVVNLYTREFYALADARLADDGVVAQWIPLHQGYVDLQKSLIRTMMERFEHVSLWLPNGGEGIALASHQPLRIDVDQLERALAEPALAADLAEVGIDRAEDLLATFVAADDVLEGWLGDVDVLTDDRPFIEYFALYEADRFRYASLDGHREPVERYVAGAVDPARLDRARAQLDALWAAEDAQTDGLWDDAVRHAEEALAFEPDDRFLQFVAAQIRWRRDHRAEL